MKKPTIIFQGKKKKLSIDIDQESVNIFIENGTEMNPKEPTHIVYWHIDEVEEDANVAISIANAIHLYHTNPQELINKLGYK